jgi:hypothetical protein
MAKKKNAGTKYFGKPLTDDPDDAPELLNCSKQGQPNENLGWALRRRPVSHVTRGQKGACWGDTCEALFRASGGDASQRSPNQPRTLPLQRL